MKWNFPCFRRYRERDRASRSTAGKKTQLCRVLPCWLTDLHSVAFLDSSITKTHLSVGCPLAWLPQRSSKCCLLSSALLARRCSMCLFMQCWLYNIVDGWYRCCIVDCCFIKSQLFTHFHGNLILCWFLSTAHNFQHILHLEVFGEKAEDPFKTEHPWAGKRNLILKVGRSTWISQNWKHHETIFI